MRDLNSLEGRSVLNLEDFGDCKSKDKACRDGCGDGREWGGVMKVEIGSKEGGVV